MIFLNSFKLQGNVCIKTSRVNYVGCSSKVAYDWLIFYLF